MSNDKTVLRAMLRLSRRCEAADEEALTVRSGATRATVRDSLRRLEAQGLIERRTERAPRLTMEGLAVAVALLPPSPAKTSRPTKRASHAA